MSLILVILNDHKKLTFRTIENTFSPEIEIKCIILLSGLKKC